MTVVHNSAVSFCEISGDGQRVVCGTICGTIGTLDKPNNDYKNNMRAHSDAILAMDYHAPRRNIITVSKDQTIRLWDMQTPDQLVEFTCAIDIPTCVSAHPVLPFFAAGFKCGKLGIFEMERLV